MEKNGNVVYELSCLASNIKKEVIQGKCIVQWFNIDRNYTLYKSIKYIYLNYSNGHGCYFFECQYFNLWIIHVYKSFQIYVKTYI